MEAKDIEAVLNNIMHPEINASIVELGMIKDINVKGNKISLKLNLPYINIPIKYILHDEVKNALSAVYDGMDIEIEFVEMTPAERDNFMEIARKAWKW